MVTIGALEENGSCPFLGHFNFKNSDSDIKEDYMTSKPSQMKNASVKNGYQWSK